MLSVLLALLIVGQAPAGSSAQRVRLYLGPVPSAEGFVVPTSKDFNDTYRDLRAEYEKNSEFRREVQVVRSIADADIVLEVIDRGFRDTGSRATSGTIIGGTTVVGSAAPIRQKRVLCRLVVGGTGYIVELNGQTGIKLVNYRQQARNLLRQVIDWVKANRSALPSGKFT